jgi:hypothetical protein
MVKYNNARKKKKNQLQNTLTTLDQNLWYCDLKGILVIHLYTKVEKTDNTRGPKTYHLLVPRSF